MAGFIPWNNNIAKYEDTPQGRKDLQDAIDQYFLNPTNTKRIKNPEYNPEDEKSQEFIDFPIYTKSGLGVALGFTGNTAVYDYIKRNNNCSIIMKKAVYWIESNYEAMLQTHNAAGIIFALKNMGWKDKQETEHTGDIVINYGHRRRKEEDDS